MEFFKEIRSSEDKTLVVFDDKSIDFVRKENEIIIFFKGCHHRNLSKILLLHAYLPY